MALSQNGWPASQRASDFVPLRWITGRVAPGAVHATFDHLGQRFNAEVEPINPAHSWGWAYRPIRGATRLSNHASGTAVDFNAPAHPLGKSDTFSKEQVKAIRRILDDLGGVVRWGGDYSGRKDEMHFEIVGSPAQVDRVAARLLNPEPTPAVVPASTPSGPTIPNTEDDMRDLFIIQHPSGAAQIVRPDGSLIGLKSAQTLENFRKEGMSVVPVDDGTWKEFHDGRP